MQVRKLSLALLLLLFTAGLLHAVPTTYVDSATDFSPANPSTGQTVTWKPGTVDAVSGLRFGTTAFSSVQAGIDAADAGGTVLIAAGTYDGGAVLDIDKNLLVRGDGDDATFLSGGSNGDNGPDSGEHRVLDISSSTAIVTLDDLAIVDGQGNVTGGSAVANNEGGGIFNLGILTLNRCLVARNVVTLGGGIIMEARSHLTVLH